MELFSAGVEVSTPVITSANSSKTKLKTSTGLKSKCKLFSLSQQKPSTILSFYKKKDDTMTSSMSYTEALDLDNDAREEIFGECVSRFETDKKPVVIFEEIGENCLDDALELWQSSASAVGVKAMFTWIDSKHQLVIFEIPETMHEQVGIIFADIISKRIDQLGLSELVEKHGAVTIKNFRGTGLEGDQTFRRMLPYPQGWKETLVVEVGWTQALFASKGDRGTSLETKAESWMGVGVSMVLIVKLFGYEEKNHPGMLVCKYTSNNKFHDVRIFGTVPESVSEKLNGKVKDNSATFQINDVTILGFEGEDLAAMKKKYQESVEQIGNESFHQEFNSICDEVCSFVDKALSPGYEFGEVTLNLEKIYNKFLLSHRLWKQSKNTVGKRSKSTKLESNSVKKQRR